MHALLKFAGLGSALILLACEDEVGGTNMVATRDIDPAAQAASRYAISTSVYDHDETLNRLLEAIDHRDLTVFAVIDHAAGASEAGLELEDATVVIFGLPQIGTSLMQAVPLLSTELPLRAAVYHDLDGTTKVATTSVNALRRDHPALSEQTNKLQTITQNLTNLRAEATGADR